MTPRAQPVSPARDEFSDAFLKGMREFGFSEGEIKALLASGVAQAAE